MILKLTNRAVNEGFPATVEEALQLNGLYSTAELCKAADAIRLKWCGNKIHTCSIVNARSGRCSENCKWCAQAGCHKTGIQEYERIPKDEALKAFAVNKTRGASCFSMVTSGRKVLSKDIAYFCGIYKEMSEQGGVELCASMGLLSREQLQQLWDSGVRKYHCNLESSPSYFATLCTTHTIEDKLATIRIAKEIGFTICCGGIIGMGETMRDRLELAAMARDAGASSIPINILQPIKGTPLQDIEPISEDEIERSVALMRFIAPKCTLHFAGGRARLSQPTTARILRGGMNGALVGDMLTTVGNNVEEDFKLFKSVDYEK
ncbi:MAG: biotin synthase BioB [Duncaniella sp.]|nr:biotin synthase BioB [Duncaniella sp.]